LYFIAGVSYEQVVVKDILSKMKITPLLTKRYVVIGPSLRFSDFLKKYQNSDEDLFLVKNGSFTGILDLKNINALPQKAQNTISVKQLALPLSKIRALQTKDSAYTAYRSFGEQNLDFLPVTERSRLAGFISKRKVMQKVVLALKFGTRK
jgi:signal-transduction protein with cAMP-binding, CBS, and nucleotidyltransferase domain